MEYTFTIFDTTTHLPIMRLPYGSNRESAIEGAIRLAELLRDGQRIVVAGSHGKIFTVESGRRAMERLC